MKFYTIWYVCIEIIFSSKVLFRTIFEIEKAKTETSQNKVTFFSKKKYEKFQKFINIFEIFITLYLIAA